MRGHLPKPALPIRIIGYSKREVQRLAAHLQHQLTQCRVDRLFALTRGLPLDFDQPKTMLRMFGHHIGATKLRVRGDLHA